MLYPIVDPTALQIIEILRYLAYFSWTTFSCFVCLGIAGWYYHNRRLRAQEYLYRTHIGQLPMRASNFRIVIVTVGASHVKKALYQCIEHNMAKFGVENVDVVTDQNAPMLPLLLLKCPSVIIVPVSYRKDLVGKGRAINYYIEQNVNHDIWYCLIDDDNLIMDDRFLMEIPFYEKQGYLAMNAMLVPRRGNSITTFIMDHIRYFDDLTIFRFFTGVLGNPLIGLHGELLTVKGIVLKTMEAYGDKSLTEDFRLGVELVRYKKKVWQSETRVSIMSPNSVRDLLCQRGRWFKGISSDFRKAPLQMRCIVGLRLITWVLGFFGSWLFVWLWPVWEGNAYSLFFFVGAGYSWFCYFYGCRKVGAYHMLALVPMMSVIESVSCFRGLRNKLFVVINKN